MNARLLLTTMIAAAMIAGCAPMPGKIADDVTKTKPKPPKHCNGPNCDSSVEITNCVAPGADCVINYDVALLAKGHQPRITFSITDPFQFENILFGPNDPFKCQASGHGSDWICKTDQDADLGVYKFTIVVRGVGLVDPWLVND